MESSDAKKKLEHSQGIEMAEVEESPKSHTDDSKVRVVTRRDEKEKKNSKSENNNNPINPEENLPMILQIKDSSVKVIPIPKMSRRNSVERLEEDEKVLGRMILDVDKGFLVKEKEYDGAANDDIEDPEIFHRLEDEVKLQHPIKDLKTYEPFEVCNSETGYMGCCGGKLSRSDLEPLGMGMVLYFKMLKVFAIVFFIIILLNIPLYYFYSINHPEYKVKSYQDALFKTSMGNVGSSKY